MKGYKILSACWDICFYLFFIYCDTFHEVLTGFKGGNKGIYFPREACMLWADLAKGEI
jgi:hypothetical protein